MSRQLDQPPVQDPWAALGHLCGVDLTGAVPCAYPDADCTAPAVWVCVQEHDRPPLPCVRTNLCAEHRLKVEMAEQRELDAGARLVCTVHHRNVPTRSRWERL